MPTLRTLAIVTLAVLGVAGLSSSWPAPHARGRHHGRATQGLDCGSCHTPDGWQVRAELRTAEGFDHDRTGFPLRAGHVSAACTQCHDGRKVVTRACEGCHVDEHRGRLGKDCSSCHSAVSFRKTDAFTLHSRTRLPLTGMHALVDCNDCHRRMTSDTYNSVPSQCFACHEQDYRRPGLHPVHDGTGGGRPFPRNCAECHRTDSFVPAVVDTSRFLGIGSAALSFDMRAHDREFVLSRGPHRGAPCESCHVQLSVPRMVRCTGCHAHGAASLASQHSRIGTPSDGSCMACHAGGLAR